MGDDIVGHKIITPYIFIVEKEGVLILYMDRFACGVTGTVLSGQTPSLVVFLQGNIL